MNVTVISFPGSNCERDIITAMTQVTGKIPQSVWHKDTDIGKPDLVIVPGGFSFGDYLRCGAIAARSPAMEEVHTHAIRGGMVLGICNGFQILMEAELLPGCLMQNKQLRFVCRQTLIKAHQNNHASITQQLKEGETFAIPVAHNDGQFYADEETLKLLSDNGQIAFTYTQSDNNEDYNPNGSVSDIAGITSENGRILGMMPHPERAMSKEVGSSDGERLLNAIIGASL